MKKFLFILFYSLIFTLSCKRSKPDEPCSMQVLHTASFAIKEMVGDTSFNADTIYRDNFVQFEATSSYDSVRWTIGNDPQIFKNNIFTLSFHPYLFSVPINFTGYRKPNTMCFPTDNGIYTSVKNLTTVEQIDRTTLTKSPLIGRYKGYFTNVPSDTFTIRIDYFDSVKYNPASFGSRNFYWISNIPKGYYWPNSNQTFNNPELQYGKQLEMGYKCFAFQGATCENGKGWISNDTLFISYGSTGCRKQFIGKRL